MYALKLNDDSLSSSVIYHNQCRSMYTAFNIKSETVFDIKKG